MSDDLKELAEELHSLLCVHNHTDQCGWFYETKQNSEERYEFDWNGWTHKQFLEKAEKLYGSVPQRPPAILSVVKALKFL